MRIGVSVKVKNPGEKRMEVKAIPDLNRDRGKQVLVNQIVDPENDRYFKRVTDYETGEVIRECEEPLSKHHIDRENAKKKNDS